MRGPEVTNVRLRHINSTNISFLMKSEHIFNSAAVEWVVTFQPERVLFGCKTILCCCKLKHVSDVVFETFLPPHISQYCLQYATLEDSWNKCSWTSYSDSPSWRHNIWLCGCFGCRCMTWKSQSVNHHFWVNLTFKLSWRYTHLDRVQQTVSHLCVHLADITVHVLHLHVAFPSSRDEQIWQDNRVY